MEWIASVLIGVGLLLAWGSVSEALRNIKATRETLEEILVILRERLPDPDPPDLY